MTSDRDNYLSALRLQKAGKATQAIEAARKVTQPEFKAGVLIDCGSDLGKIPIVREGISLLEDVLRSGGSRASRASLLYNIGNGYLGVYDIRRRQRPNRIPMHDDDLRAAKRTFRMALAETTSRAPKLRSQVLVNYGNCLSSLGRSFEAIGAYQQALEAEPTNGMAAGNLGIELRRVSQVMERYMHHYIVAAYDLLTKACGPEMHLDYGDQAAADAFRLGAKQLKSIIDAHRDGLPPLQKVVYGKSHARKQKYIRFCVEHGLFLNAWVGDPDVTPAVLDEIAYGPITVRQRDTGTVVELLRILNEIKEAYSTARYVYYLSTSKSRILDGFSAMTDYYDAIHREAHGLYIGLCKTAYSRAFDVLDKIARMINVYFGIGRRNDHFWHVFAEKQSRGESHELRYVARPAIIHTGNYGLYALSDVCIDYFESEHVDLKTFDERRNQITHDYLALRFPGSSTGTQSEAEVSLDEFSRQTLAVLHFARLATLYAVSSIRLAEATKDFRGTLRPVRYDHGAGHSARELQGRSSRERKRG